MNQQTSNSNPVNHSPDPATLSPDTGKATGNSPRKAKRDSRASSSRPHCRHRIRKGRYCQLPVLDVHSRLCFRHSALRNQEVDSADLSPDLLGEVREFKSASDVHAFLAKLLCLLAQNRVATKRAAVMAYITNQLLRALTAIGREAQTKDDTIVIDIDSAVTRRALEARRAEREQSNENRP
jgi:hypothetical protein